MIELPPPREDGSFSLEKALAARRSVRDFSTESLTLEEMSQILWSAQGVTLPSKNPPRGWEKRYQWRGGYRTAPSAGALYPLELYVVVSRVERLEPGLYRFLPVDHALMSVAAGQLMQPLADAAAKQSAVGQAAANIVVTGIYERVGVKYADRTELYVHLEAGAVTQNVALQAAALGLGSLVVGAFSDAEVKALLDLTQDYEPLAILSLGRKR